MKEITITVKLPDDAMRAIERSPVPVEGRFLDFIDHSMMPHKRTPDFSGMSAQSVNEGFQFLARAGLSDTQIRLIRDASGYPFSGVAMRARSTSGILAALAAEVKRPPVRKQKDTAESRSRRQVRDAIARGDVGFRGGWVSSVHMDKLVQGVPPCKRRALMNTIGYDWHPALTDGRVNNAVQCDFGKKSRLYVSWGNPSRDIKKAVDATRAYEGAQL